MEVHLNASALFSPNSLTFSLSSADIPTPFRVLLDSGSSHCFIDSAFCSAHNLRKNPISPLRLRLFDGSSNSAISETVDLCLRFPTGESLPCRLLVTPLDPSCSAVLGYDWLTRYNPLIDWVSGSLTFRASVPDSPTPPTPVSSVEDDIPQPVQSDPAPPATPSPLPSVSLVNAEAFVRACHTDGAQSFRLQSDLFELLGRSSTTEPADLVGLPSEYHEFADVFSSVRSETLAPHRPYDLKIDLEDGAEPPLGPIYSLSPLELQALREFIDENLRSGFIRPSSSAHGAPVLFVKKKDGSLRLCVDFRGLNRISKKDRYPLPLISDLLDAPRKARLYTKIDLRHAYHLVRIADGDEWKTAFRTRYGSFEWRVMPFGLTNAPAAFQRFMNDIFSDLLDVCVIVYLDDILIYSDNPDDHPAHVRTVLERLRKHGLYARADKCLFSVDTVEYLGYLLSPSGLTMDPSKVQVIRDWPEPRKVKDIQSFLGFANFYRRFIHNYSDIVVPLTRLTRKDAPWNFSDECRSAFDNLKSAFSSAPILTHWEPDRQLIVETDASDYAIAGILSIVCEDSEIRPVAYHSRTLNPSELNYDTHDKELLAIFESFRTWRHYLEGSATPVDVVTDHKNLEYFSTTKLLTRRQARWSEFLSGFNLIIRFRPGRLGEKPDSLTRRWDVYPKEGDSGYAHVNPHNFKPVFTQEQLSASLRASALYGPVLRAVELLDVQQLHDDIRAAIPSDPIASRFLSDTSDPRWTTANGFVLHDGRIYVPDAKDLRLRVLQYKHDHPLSGHFGQGKTISLIRREYVWPGLRDFVKDYCRSCVSCKRGKSVRHKPYGLLRQLPIPARPWDSISMDFIEHLPISSGFTAILVIIDRLSKQGIFIPTYDTVTSQDLAKLFVLHVFSKHGVPGHVTSDRGSEFVSHFFRSLGKLLDMRLHFTSGYHPEGDGQTERVNQTLEQYLRMYCNYQQDNWSDLLPIAEFAYNNAPNDSTGLSPFFANKGYNPALTVHPERDISSARALDFAVDLDTLHQELRSSLSDAQRRYQGPADARRLPAPDFKVGDFAFVKAQFFRTTRPSKKLSEKYLGPYEIIAQAGPSSFTLRLPDSMRAIHPVFHVSQLEPATPNTIPNRTQPPPPPVEVDGELEYEIAQILDSKIDNRRRSKLLYKVRWAGYEGTPDEEDWLPASELAHAQELVSDFHARYPNKPGPAY